MTRMITVPCDFCDYAGPSTVRADYNDTIVIEPLNPVTPGHVLAVPKQHCGPRDLTAAARAFECALWWAKEQNLGSFNVITSVGYAATQTVPHLHVHVVPRRPGDGLKLPWSL